MQASGQPALPAALHSRDVPLGEQLYVAAHIKNNHDVLNFK